MWLAEDPGLEGMEAIAEHLCTVVETVQTARVGQDEMSCLSKTA